MNYHSMNLRELRQLLVERKLGDSAINNELGKIYGVTHMPPQQEAARQDAIRRLQEYDKNKSSSKIIKFIIGSVSFVAAVCTIVALILAVTA